VAPIFRLIFSPPTVWFLIAPRQMGLIFFLVLGAFRGVTLNPSPSEFTPVLVFGHGVGLGCSPDFFTGLSFGQVDVLSTATVFFHGSHFFSFSPPVAPAGPENFYGIAFQVLSPLDVSRYPAASPGERSGFFIPLGLPPLLPYRFFMAVSNSGLPPTSF